MRRPRTAVRLPRAVVGALPPEYTPATRAYGDQHWTILNWAKLALTLGARRSVVERITGIQRSELLRLFYHSSDDRKSPGGFPSSAEWFIKANLITTVHATDFYAIYDKLRNAGNLPAEALIKAFEKYSRNYQHDPRLTFDRAFHLISQVDGLWSKDDPELQAVACNRCQSIYIAARWKVKNSCDECPLCKLTKKFECSVRVSKRLSPPGLAKLFHAHEVTISS